MLWPLSEAKRKFGKLIQAALDEAPQIVTRRGEEVVVVISVEEYKRLSARKPDLKEFLLSGPSFDDLDLERIPDLPRPVPDL